MRMVALGVLAASLALIVMIVFKRKLGWRWLTVFGAHVALAGIALYGINYMQWLGEWHVPINPVTMGTVAILGVPGIALLLGLKMTLYM